jgi:hypothetical protein
VAGWVKTFEPDATGVEMLVAVGLAFWAVRGTGGLAAGLKAASPE